MRLRGSQTNQRAEPNLAVYELWTREGVPNFSHVFRLHAHLFHQSVEEVFSLCIGMGPELTIEVVEQLRHLIEVDRRP
jgi:hypothetical protein